MSWLISIAYGLVQPAGSRHLNLSSCTGYSIERLLGTVPAREGEIGKFGLTAEVPLRKRRLGKVGIRGPEFPGLRSVHKGNELVS